MANLDNSGPFFGALVEARQLDEIQIYPAFLVNAGADVLEG